MQKAGAFKVANFVKGKIMKKLCLLFVLFACFSYLVFAQADEQEELDYLLFQPNSGSLFVNQEQAALQLDNLAKYLLGKDLIPGQIFAYGYAAAVANDIEPIDLSKERALFVIGELQKRGVSENFFSEPVAYGSVDLWGSNADEEARSPNRRVRILLDGSFLTPAVIDAVEPEIKISSADTQNEPYPKDQVTQKSKGGPSFLKYLLLFLIFFVFFAAILLMIPKRGKKPASLPAQETPREEIQAIVPAAPIEIKVNLDEEIRFRAYELYLQKGAWNGGAEEDWYQAVQDVSGRYEAQGYSVYTADGSWWAKQSD
jgi:hypothetical protein